MSDLLRSPKAKIGAAVAGGLLIVLAAWFLLVSPQRAKANELSAEVGTARRRELDDAEARAGEPVGERDGEAERSLPPDEGAAGRDRHVGHPPRRQPPRGAERADVPVDHAVAARWPAPATSSSRSPSSSRAASATSRASSATSARSSRSRASASTPAAGSTRSRRSTSPPRTARSTFPVVKATVTLNAYSFSAPVPTTTTPDPSTTTDTSSSGTVAAGATP